MQLNKVEFGSLEKFHLAPLLDRASLLYGYHWIVNSRCSGLWNGNWNLSRKQISQCSRARPSLKYKLQTHLKIIKEPQLSVFGSLAILTNIILMWWYSHKCCESWGGHMAGKAWETMSLVCSQEVYVLVKEINAIYMIPENAWPCIIKCQKVVMSATFIKRIQRRKNKNKSNNNRRIHRRKRPRQFRGLKRIPWTS